MIDPRTRKLRKGVLKFDRDEFFNEPKKEFYESNYVFFKFE